MAPRIIRRKPALLLMYIEELTTEVPLELTNEELVMLEEERKEEEERRQAQDEAAKEDEPERKFTVKGLSNLFKTFNELRQAEEMDPNIERYTKIERILQEGIRPYRQIYEEKKKTNNTDESRYVCQESYSPSHPCHYPWSSSHQATITPPPPPVGDSDEDHDDPPTQGGYRRGGTTSIGLCGNTK